MNRALFRIIFFICWLGLCLIGFATRGAIAEAMDRMWNGFPDQGVYAILFIFGLTGIYVGSLIDARLLGEETLDPTLPLEVLQARAKRLAARHVAAGNHRDAILAYEAAKLWHQALELALRHQEHPMAARILLQMGRKDRARKHYAESGDFLMAANLSMLVGELKDARSWYARAAEKAPERMPLGEKAALWDRALDRPRAAAMFEDAGDFRNAAECREMLGETEKARQLSDQAAMVEAYEKRRQGETSTAVMSPTDRRHQKAAQAGHAEAQGDFYGAAMALRDLREWRRAGELFERAEEWLRAARCFEAAGDAGRATELLSRMGRPPAPAATAAAPPPAAAAPSAPAPPAAAPSPSAASGPTAPGSAGVAAGPPPPPAAPPAMPPDPRQLPAVVFVPVDQMPWAMGAQGAPAMSPAAGAIPQGRVPLDQAARQELQAGRIQSAQDQFRAAGRSREAALLAMSVGDYASAAEILVDALEEKNDPDVGLLLGQLLIRLRDYDLAEKVFRTRFAPQIDEKNSVLAYQWGRMFEDAEALEPAARIYREILESGATSTDLSTRLQSVEERLRMHAGRTVVLPPGMEPDARLTAVEHHVERTLGAAHFLQRFLEDTESSERDAKPSAKPGPAAPAPAPKPKAPARPYPFSPPALSRDTVPMLRSSEKPTDAVTAPAAGSAKDRQPIPPPRPVPLNARPRGQISILGTEVPAAPADPAKPAPEPISQERRYEIVRELGAGGMGVVYEAKDTLLDRRVALKLLNSFGAGQDQLRQFLLEARAIARLSHPAVIGVYDMGMMDLRHYIAMEFVEGTDLRGLVNEKKRLPVKDSLRLFVEIAEGLRAAHEAGILHRDIKPANILLTKDQRAKIVDFGLAKLPRQDQEESTIFRNAGTPGYMAPEQASGGTLGPACDIYALGITLFTMLVGEPPHRLAKLRTTNDILIYQAAGDYPRLRDLRAEVPPAVEHLFRYCTAAKQEERYQSVDAFLDVARQWRDVV